MSEQAPTPARVYHEPVPAYMQRLSMMGARFITGNTGDGAAGNEGGNGGESTQSSDQGQQPGQQQQQGEQGQQGNDTTQNTAQPTSTEPPEQQGEQGLEQASHADLVSQIRELRRENAKDRTSAKETAAQQATNELTQKLGKALGLIKDGDDTPDAEQLTAQLTEQTNTAQQAQLELAVYKAAANPDLGADAAALLDSRSFLEKVADLDPTKTADLEQAIKDTVKDNPRLQQSGQVPPKRSSNPLNNSKSGTPLPESPEELANLIPRGY